MSLVSAESALALLAETGNLIGRRDIELGARPHAVPAKCVNCAAPCDPYGRRCDYCGSWHEANTKANSAALDAWHRRQAAEYACMRREDASARRGVVFMPRWGWAGLVLLLAVLWPDAARAQVPEPEGTVTVLAGGGVSMSDQSAPIPTLRVTSDNPAFVGGRGDALGRLRVDLAISGLPGESVEGLQHVENWVSAELYGEGQIRVGSSKGSETMVVARAGFVTRILPGDKEPRQRFARLYGGGVRAQHRGDGAVVDRSIALLYGRDEIASPDAFHAGQLTLEGQVRLKSFGSRGEVTIVGDAHLQLGHHHGAGERDVMRLGIAIGWGG